MEGVIISSPLILSPSDRPSTAIELMHLVKDTPRLDNCKYTNHDTCVLGFNIVGIFIAQDVLVCTDKGISLKVSPCNYVKKNLNLTILPRLLTYFVNIMSIVNIILTI